MHQHRTRSQALVGLEELEYLPDENFSQPAADRGQALDRLLNLIQRLKPLDRHVILSYLEHLDAASIERLPVSHPATSPPRFTASGPSWLAYFSRGDKTMNKLPHDPVQQIWRSQPVEGIQMSVETLRRRAGKFEGRILWRNVREYAGSAIAAALFGYFFAATYALLLASPTLCSSRASAGLSSNFIAKAPPRVCPPPWGASTSLQFFRTELEPPRDVVKNVWPWYLAPLAPGFAVLTVAYALARPFPASLAGAAWLDGAVAALFFFLVWKMNMRAVRCLQRTIDELYAAENH